MTIIARRGSRLRAGLALLAFAACAEAAFTPGNIVVYRIGSGTGPLATSGNPVFLDEYTPAGTLVVPSVALPSVSSGASKSLVASGTSVTDGLLTRSTDGTCLLVPGYGRDLGPTTNLTTAAGVPRVVGRVTAAGGIDTTTALTDAFLTSNFRSAASTDCVSFWMSGTTGGSASGGVRFTTLGSTTSVDLSGAAISDTRAVAIFNGQLFTWNNTSAAVHGVATIGTGTPTLGLQAFTRLPGLSDANSGNTYQFFFADLFADLDGVPRMHTLYIADAGAAALTKFSLNAGTWVAKGTIGASTDVYRGLAGTVVSCTIDPVTCPTGKRVTLYATRRTGSVSAPGGELVTVTDLSGYNGAFAGSPTLLATAGANTVFRGVALAPAITLTPSAGSNGTISPSDPQLVAGGARGTFIVTPNAGFTAVVGGTCGGSLAGNTFTTVPAVANCTVAASFTQIPTFVVTPGAGPNGSIAPNTPRTVLTGDIVTFTITPATGYAPSVDGTCGGTLSGNTYTTAPVTADCTVNATFTLITRTVTPSADANGTITPNSPQIVPLGTKATFTVAAAFGYSASVSGTCGGTLDGTTYTTNAVDNDCTVAASFTALPRFTVTPSASANGTISPSTPQLVISGQSAAFAISPASGYSGAVRGTCGGTFAAGIFTTAPVSGDCTVVATFARKLVLFVGNSFTHGRVDPALSYNAANVTDLTAAMAIANFSGSNLDEPHPWGGIPGIFKKLTDQAGLDYDVSISARSAATLRGQYLNSNPANWDLRGNIASQPWDTVILQDLSDEPLPPNRGANANLPYFNAYTDKLDAWVRSGAAESYTESELFGGSAADCSTITGASLSACDSLRTIAPANANARAAAQVFLYETWARPDMIAPNGTNASGPFYTAAEGLEAMTADFHAAYFGRAAANANIAGVSPVGDAFLRAVHDGYAMRDPYVPEAGKIDLWHTDFFHPSKYGSYLSALVHYATLTGRDPMAFGADEQAAADLGIAPDIAMQLQRVARETVMPDTTAPITTATISAPPNGNGLNNTAVTVTFAAIDDAGGWGASAVSYALTGAQSASGTVPPGGTVTVSAEGETTLTYFATDIAGNAEAPRTLVIRIDATAPVLSVPASFSVDTSGANGAVVTYDASASDNSGLAPQFACAPASGATFAVGVTQVSCTATDAAGNTATASFTVSVRRVFTITPSAGANGSISPATAQIVAASETHAFTVVAAAGYAAAVGGTCGGTFADGTFTIGPASADCTVVAIFTLITRTVTPSAGANGSITPSSPQIIPLGSTASFTVAAAFGYSASVGGTCGGVLAGSTYTTDPVPADCTVVASFTPLPRYVVTPSASANGTASPALPQSVTFGQSASFTIAPAPGYSTAIRGSCGGTLVGDTFTTSPVTRDCTVAFTFARKLVLFVGDSYTLGRAAPVMNYNTGNVSDLTHEMWLANRTGTNDDEPHPWGGVPGIFKKLTVQAGLDYDVSISARDGETLRGHYLDTNVGSWDLRGNIASQRWDAVVLQDAGDEPLPAGRGARASLAYFDAYADRIEGWIHRGAAETLTESQLFGAGSSAQCRLITGATEADCDTAHVIAPASTNARAIAEVFLHQTWARPDMISANATLGNGLYYTAAEGLEAMTKNLHDAYFARAAANADFADVSPVGDAFLRAVQDGVAVRDPRVPEPGKINLWLADGTNPSKYGSYLSALVHFATITGSSPMMFGAGELSAIDLGIAPDVAVQLQRVARETVSPDSALPVTVATLSEAPNAAGWNNHDVTVAFAATDVGWGVASVRYALSGAQTAPETIAPSGGIRITAEGVTTITYFAVDLAGNREAARTLRISIDKTAPVISGMPGAGCSLWPPNHKMVQVATISASGGVSGLATFNVVATSSEPAAPGESDTSITGTGIAPRVVSLRADRNGSGPGRTYTIVAYASDAAGNAASASATCTVPHDKGK